MCRAGGLRGVRTPTAGQRQHSYGSGRHRRRHPDRAGRAEHCVDRDGPCRRLTRSRILRRRSVLSFPRTIPSVGRGSQERPGAGRPCRPAGDDRCPASAFGRIAPAHAARASTGTPILANGGAFAPPAPSRGTARRPPLPHPDPVESVAATRRPWSESDRLSRPPSADALGEDSQRLASVTRVAPRLVLETAVLRSSGRSGCR
jgi:hypothetical protein